MRSRIEKRDKCPSGRDTHEVLHGVDVDLGRHRRRDDETGVDSRRNDES